MFLKQWQYILIQKNVFEITIFKKIFLRII